MVMYCLNAIEKCGLLGGTKPSLMSHLYFVVVTFFTLGFGDMKEWIGQAAVIVISFCSLVSISVGLERLLIKCLQRVGVDD
jgi:hypothetical protein